MLLDDNYNRKIYTKMPPVDPATGLLLRYGNGCSRHDNCFTCTETDCVFNTSKSMNTICKNK